MSTFKYKPKKQVHKKKKDKNIGMTLDVKHKNKINHFIKNKNSLPELKSNLDELNKKLLDFNNLNYYNCTFDDISNKAEIKDKIKVLEKKIYDIENNID